MTRVIRVVAFVMYLTFMTLGGWGQSSPVTGGGSSLPSGGSDGQCLVRSGGVPAWGSCSGTTSSNFSAIVADSPNVSAGTFQIGNGTTLRTTGTGSLIATSVPFSGLSNQTANLSLSQAHFTTVWTYDATTGASTNIFTITDTLNNTGTGIMFDVDLASGSQMRPARFAVNGNGVEVSSAGLLSVVGSGGINATQLNGATFASPSAIGTGAPAAITGTVINATTGLRFNGAATIGNVFRGDGTNFVATQLGYTDLSGLPTLAANTTATAHNFFTAYNSSTGAFTKAQPVCADLSDATGGCNLSLTAGGDISGTLPNPTVAKVNGVTYPSTPSTDTVPLITAANTATYKAVNSCGDSSHALSYSTVTHSFGCQAITGTASAGGSTTQMQYNNGGALAGDTGCTTDGAGNLTCVTFNTSGTGADTYTEIAAPASPTAGAGSVWYDSSDHRLHDKNSGGVIGTTVVADTGAGNNFLTAISSAGAISKARPTCANLSDSAGGCTMSTTATGDLSGTLPSATVVQIHETRTSVNNAASPYTVVAADSVIDCDATAGGVTINLPAATGSHREITIKKIDSSANACTPTRASTNTIDGATTVSLVSQYAATRLYDNASGTWDRLEVDQGGGDVTGASTNAVVAKVNGTSVPVNSAADQVIGTTAAATGSWLAVPNCGDSSHGLAYSTTTHSFSCQAITGSAGGVSDPGANGVMVRTALNTTTARTITGTTNRIAITNGDGTAGNPTIDIGTNVPTMAAAGTGGNLIQSAASDRTQSDSGIATANVATMASAAAQSGNVIQSAGANKTQSDSGVAVANLVTSASAASAAKQICVASGASKTCSFIDFPDVKIIPAANCNNATAGAGWNIPASGVTPACRAGSNNLGGALQMTPSAGTGVAQFEFELPVDWDTGVKPYVAIYYGSGSNTTGTVIWTVSTACTKQDGSVTDDPAFIAESAMGAQTMAAASRMWSQSAELAGAMTNCIGGSTMYVKVALSGTATSAINVYKATITTPRLLTLQAN